MIPENLYDEEGNWTGSEAEQVAYNAATSETSPYASSPYTPLYVTPNDIAGYYSNVGPNVTSGAEGYTGAPQTIEEEDYITGYFNQYGVRPSSQQASDYMRGTYGQGFRGGMNAYDPNLRYRPGSTMYELGYRAPGDYGAGEQSYGAYSGTNVPYDTTVVMDINGNPMRRFPTQRAAQGAGYTDPSRYFAPDNKMVYPQRPVQQPFQTPEKLSFEQFLNQRGIASVEQFKKELLIKYPNIEKPITQEEWDMNEANIIGRNKAFQGLDDAYNYYAYVEYPNQVNTARNEWQQAQQTGQEPLFGNVGAMADTSGTATAQINAENDYRQGYQQLSDSLRLDPQNQVWMQQNYSVLIATWLASGQGTNFMEWVRSYLGGGQPEPIRRYAPPVLNR